MNELSCYHLVLKTHVVDWEQLKKNFLKTKVVFGVNEKSHTHNISTLLLEKLLAYVMIPRINVLKRLD